jgi:hypothetical protein
MLTPFWYINVAAASMIDARARRPRSVTGSARADIDDDADTDLVYRRDMPVPGIRSVPHAPDRRLGAIAVAPSRCISKSQLAYAADSWPWERYDAGSQVHYLRGRV